MQIKLHKITVRDLAAGYSETEDGGVVGYGGKLNIRPPYQREFIYDDQKRDAVLTTILKGFPLNVMYWADNGDGTYEMIDGQQRTISICRYVAKMFSYKKLQFNNQTADIQQLILDYELMIYICDGTESEKMDWFEVINIAGEELTKQELRNAIYHGPWLSDAKRYFSKKGCPAQKLGGDYLNGSAIRQDYLETAIRWMSRHDNPAGKGDIEEYMDRHRQDANAQALWLYFKQVIDWVGLTFVTYRKEMRGLDWATLYEKHKDEVIDNQEVEQEISRLMQDGEIRNKRGIYLYVLDHEEQHLDLREFDEKTRREVYEEQQGICPLCKKKFAFEMMHGDHIVPWSKGGRTVKENCQMLCARCNTKKSAKI